MRERWIDFGQLHWPREEHEAALPARITALFFRGLFTSFYVGAGVTGVRVRHEAALPDCSCFRGGGVLMTQHF